MALFARSRIVGYDALPAPASCDFLAIDFETANERRGSACAVGVALVCSGMVTARGSVLINPEVEFNPYCSAVNGICAAHVASAPTFPAIWSQLTQLLNGQVVVAHNCSFDISVLRNTAARYGLEDGPAFKALCTMRLARLVWPALPSYGLGYLAPALGMTFAHHQAGDDATACAGIAQAICTETGHATLTAAAEWLRVLPGRLTAESYVPLRLADSASLTTMAGRADADHDHPLYGRTICFTGALQSMLRRDAQERVVEVGCDFKNNVSRQLDYLVIGDGDYVRFVDGWQTGKLKKAIEPRAEGYAIEILAEQHFLEMLLS
jgi:DNA polymerase-3 subunit epsilon